MLNDLELRRKNCLTEMERLDLEMITLKDKLQKAKVRAVTKGEYTNPDWFRETTKYVAQGGVRRQRLQIELGDISRNIKMNNEGVRDALTNLIHVLGSEEINDNTKLAIERANKALKPIQFSFGEIQ